MADQFVETLNDYGYQPVFLPHTGYTPPDLYTFAEHNLVRHGSLKAYLSGATSLPTQKGDLANIEGKVTSKKEFGAALGFLTKALSVLGIGSLPKLDLKFAGTNEFAFALTGLSYVAVDPTDIESIMQNLKIPAAIPDNYIPDGLVHIAYEYAYATAIRMSRADGKKFTTDISGSIGSWIDIGLNANVEVSANTTISFSSKDSTKLAAFAYKAGQVQQDEDGHYTFEPEVVMKGLKAAPKNFLPAPKVVLVAAEQLITVAA